MRTKVERDITAMATFACISLAAAQWIKFTAVQIEIEHRHCNKWYRRGAQFVVGFSITVCAGSLGACVFKHIMTLK